MYLNKLMDIIKELTEKYKTNLFMNDKLNQYLSNLPHLMQTIEDQHNQRTHQLNILNETY